MAEYSCGVVEQYQTRDKAMTAEARLGTKRPLVFIQDALPGWSKDATATAYMDAASRWTAGADIAWTLITDMAQAGPSNIVNRVSVADLGGGGVLADQMLPSGQRILQMRMNSRISWVKTDGSMPGGKVDAVRVFAHEIGHFIGHEHWPRGAPPELMEPFISDTIIKPQATELAVTVNWFGPPVPVPGPDPTPTPTPSPDPWPNCCRGVLGFNQAFNHIRHNRERIMAEIPRLTAAEARDVLALQQAVAEVVPPWVRNYLVLAQRAAALPWPKIIDVIKGLCPTNGAPTTPINWVEVLLKIGTMLLCPTAAVEVERATAALGSGENQ